MDSNITELKFQQDCFLWHWNTRPQQRGRLFMVHNTPENSIKGTQLKGAGMVRGVPDLIYLLPNGKCIFIELKQGTSQSNFQKWFEKIANVFTTPYYIIETLIDFQNLIKNYEIYSPVNFDLPYPLR